MGAIAETTSASFAWNVVGGVMVLAVVGILLLKTLEKPAEERPEPGSEGGAEGGAE